MSTLATPIRGLRLLMVGVGLMMARYAADLLLVGWLLFADERSIDTMITWASRLQLVTVLALVVLLIGMAMNVDEQRRRRLSLTPAVLAIAALAVSLVVQAWLYELLRDLADLAHGQALSAAGEERLASVDQVPTRAFIATVGYVVGLFGAVLMVRAYAITSGQLGVREQARNIGGMLALLLAVDTFYRFTYQLGSGVGLFGVCVGVPLMVFWLWCHRQLGRLFDSARYYLRVDATVPTAEVIRDRTRARSATAPPLAVAPAASPPPLAAQPLAVAPLAAKAPVAEAPTLTSDGPRFLR